MKKRLLILLAALLCLVCALALTACEEEPEAPAPEAPAPEAPAPEAPAHTHAWGEWVETTAPTCTTKGIKTRACACGQSATQYVDIDPNAHAPATAWTTDGTHHWKVCTRTGCTAQLSKTTHSYGDWVVTLAPTCVAEGSHYRDCTVCAYRQTEAIPIDASNHAPATDWTTDGTRHWKVCTRTGCTAQLSKTTHSYGDWVVTLAPTCVAEGSHYRDCTICAYRQTEAIPIDASKHAPAAYWETDGTHHWKICTRTGCTAQVNKTAHTSAAAWSSDAANHWKDCTACGYDTTLAPHTYDAENTCVCGDYKDKGVRFTLSSGTYAVTDYTGTATEVIIPATYKGVAVTSIGDYAFYYCSNLTSVTIPASVTSIGDNAFEDCSNLTAVEFGANSRLTSIGNAAFYDCSQLTSVTIPASATSIGSYAFQNCSDLTSITIPAGVTGIGAYTFSGCSQLTSVTIPASVTSIGNYAFRGCSGLTSITIPAGVTVIGDQAFYNCSQLTTVEFGANSQLTGIGDYAFFYCSKLTSVTIPTSVTSIGDRAFYNCSQLTTVEFGANSQLTGIGEYAFYGCTGLTTVEFGANSQLTSIGNAAFYDCSQLTSITIPAGVTSIGSSAFRGCTGLKSITLPFVGANLNGTENTHLGYIFGASSSSDQCSSVPTSLKTVIITGGTGIGYDAFYGCTSLTTVTIPASVTSIGFLAFFGCTGLTAVYITDLAAWCNITFGSYYANPLYYAKKLYLNGRLITALEIPSGITAIKDYAFRNCSDLTSITIPAGVTVIGDQAFYNCSQLTTVEFGANSQLTGIGDDAFYWCSNLTAVYISDLAAWCNIEFGNYSANPFDYADNLYLNGQLVTALEIPSGITAIKGYAFRGCSGLTSVTIPSSVTSIGERAFYDCYNLTTVEFDANSQLTSIGDEAFAYCSKLTSITIPASVTSIGDDAFRYCSKLTSVTFANPNGWWYAPSDTATSGTAIPAADLSNASTAATYLTSTYYDYYWKRT